LETTKVLPSDIFEELPESYAMNKGPLHIPQEVRNFYAEKGFNLYWIGIYTANGELDGKNIRTKEMQGYTFVTQDEIPSMKSQLSSHFSSELNKHDGLIVMGDCALAKIEQRIVDAKRKEIARLTRERSAGIVRDIREAKLKGKFETTRSSNQEGREVDFK
jgi:hypothetical protein